MRIRYLRAVAHSLILSPNLTVPPMVIHEAKSKMLHEEFAAGLPAGFLVGRSPSGYVTEQALVAWAMEFVKHIRHSLAIKPSDVTFLFIDGYIVHTCTAFLQYLLDNNVQVIFIPAHTSEKLQPLVRMRVCVSFFSNILCLMSPSLSRSP